MNTLRKHTNSSQRDHYAFPMGDIAWAALSAYVLYEYAPLLSNQLDGIVVHIYPALALILLITCAVPPINWCIYHLHSWLQLRIALKPRGVKGSASWAQWKSLKGDLKRYGWYPYWGVYAGCKKHRGKVIMADYASNAVTFGTAGSGKGVGVVLPNILSIRESKLIMDFKTTNAVMVKAPLEARGEMLHVLNIGGLHEEGLGASACYNPLSIIWDDFNRTDGILDVNEDVAEFAMQLYPNPANSDGDDLYWRNGSRNLIEMALKQVILVHGQGATLGDVDELLIDREAFLQEMLWASGQGVDDTNTPLSAMPLELSPWVKLHQSHHSENFIADYRIKAKALVDLLSAQDNKTGESFLTGARQALKDFNKTSRAHKVLSSSTFRFADMKSKDKPVNVAIAIDASRMNTQSTIAALLQWAAFTEWKRHANKYRPVYVISDETTNMKVFGLPSLQTWGREYGIRIHMFIQSIAAYRTVYGKDAVNTLLSETEVKQFLPHQRDPEMLELIQKLLGQESIVTKSHNGNVNDYGLQSFGLSEQSKPLMSADEIRCTAHTLLFIRGNKPILGHLPSIASIAPWRKQIGNNPFYGKPYLKKVTLRLGKRRTPLFTRLLRGHS